MPIGCSYIKHPGEPELPSKATRFGCPTVLRVEPPDTWQRLVPSRTLARLPQSLDQRIDSPSSATRSAGCAFWAGAIGKPPGHRLIPTIGQLMIHSGGQVARQAVHEENPPSGAKRPPNGWKLSKAFLHLGCVTLAG
jgi:hypothetical protein